LHPSAVDLTHEHHPITSTEIYNAIAQCNLQSAAGPDKFSYKVIKHAHDTSPHHLPQLFNAIIATGCYPTLWKQANCVVIAKPGKRGPSQAKSYRPISLLSHIAKMMEKIMARPITRAALQCKALDTSQFGATENRSAIDALCAILHPSSLWLMQPNKTCYPRKPRPTLLANDIQGAFNNPDPHRLVKIMET
jgi:hypothetical protein